METLYKRTRTGAIQQWTVSVEGADIIKEAGQLGGKMTYHRETAISKNVGKSNETTPQEQAQLQAESDHRKKKDEGYKSLVDLNILPELEGENLSVALEANLPQFNTDANGQCKPMLAVDWAGGKKVKYPCYAQPKFDGVRCLMIVEFTNDGALITFLSRSGKPYTTLSHIIPDVERYCESTGTSFILDGEVYADGISFQEVTRLVKKERENSTKLHFRAYDIVNDKNQVSRLQEMTEICDAIGSPYIWPTVTLTLNNADEVRHHHDEWVKEGYEGAILRHTHALYAQGQRSSDLLKVKEFDEAEFAFSFWETGQREEDLLAVLKTSEGKVFRCKMTGTREQKDEMRTQLPLQITVKHFGWTEDKLPRFPIGKAIRDYD